MNPGGIVVIVENESADASGFMLMMKRLGNPEYRYKVSGGLLTEICRSN